MAAKMQVRDRSVILYPESDSSSYSEKRRDNMLAVRTSRYSGTMTGGARKRLTKSITLMAQAVKPRWIHNPVINRTVHHHLSFMTLTIANCRNLTGQEAYTQLLAPFLQWLRDTRCTIDQQTVKAYVWKAEKQKRGQIHYHLVIPDFIHHRKIRQKWNALQKKAGLLDDYAKEHGHFNPPSTEMKAKKTGEMKYLVKDIVSEMAKTVDAWELEIAKQVDAEIESGQLVGWKGFCDLDYLRKAEIAERLEKKVSIEGKTWDCSLNLSRAKYFTITVTPAHFDAMKLIENQLIFKQEDWFAIITFTGEGPPNILSGYEKWQMENHFKNILNDTNG